MPPRSRTATALIVGSELTSGQVRDSHGQFLAAFLEQAGLRVVEICLVPDDLETIKGALGRAVRDSDVVVLTGGLGPTSDDITREAVAECAGEPLEFHAALWDQVSGALHGRDIPAVNRRQAQIPRGFVAVSNDWGTAPGFYGSVGNALVVALPGPPRELEPMATAKIAPILLERFGMHAPPSLSGTSFLLSESALEEGLREERVGKITWSTRAEPARVLFSFRGGDRRSREQTLAGLVRRFGGICIWAGERRPHSVLSDELRRRRLVLVTAESCTGGMIAEAMTDMAGSSDVFWGGVVTYANEAKAKLLGVTQTARCGAVSGPVVREMAAGALSVSGADVAISTSGIAGPSGGSDEKPIGTVWISVAVRDQEALSGSWKLSFSGPRSAVRLRATVAALLLTDACLRGTDIDNNQMWYYI